MTSIKIKYRPSTIKIDEGTVYVQVIHNRELKQIKSSLSIKLEDWDPRLSKVRDPIIQNQVEVIVSKLKSSIEYLDQTQCIYRIIDIISAYENYHKRGVFVFMEQIITKLKDLGKSRTAETYATTLRSFQRFRGNEEVGLNKIDSNIIKSYEVYLVQNGIAPNTIAFYMRILRATYNRAVDDGLTIQKYPFKYISTRTEKTIKRAISSAEIKAIKEVGLSRFPAMEFARDIFMLSFYTRGMSFIDMAYLRKSDLRDGVLSYRRRKTNQLLHIRWERCMQDIVERHTSYNHYLLPIIKDASKDERNQYKVAIFRMNSNLKRVAKLAGITKPLTSYVARHSWASIARSKNIPMSVISEGMGHESESTTQIYLASFDSDVIDNANNLIINGL